MHQDEAIEFDDVHDIGGSIVLFKVWVREPGGHINEFVRLIISRNAVRLTYHPND